MLNISCLNPTLLKILTGLGHGDRILIADGNFSIQSNSSENAEIINLALTRGIPLVTDVLKVIKDLMPIERVQVIDTPGGKDVKVYKEFSSIIGKELKLEKFERFEFYNECRKSDVKLAIATGEPRLCADIILTVGCLGEYEYV